MFSKMLVSTITKLVDKRGSIPVLSGVLIDADKKTISMTDMDMLAVFNDVPIEGEGAMVVNADALKKIAQTAKESLTFEIGDLGLDVIADGEKYLMKPLAKSDDFPIMTEMQPLEAEIADVTPDIFSVAFAASTEEARYYLCGTYLHTHDGKLTACATNGHIAALHTIDAQVTGPGHAPSMEAILPTKAVRLIEMLAEGRNFTLKVHGVKVLIEFGNVTFLTKVIDGTFPDIYRVLPRREDVQHRLTVPASELLAMTKKAQVVGAKPISLRGEKDGWYMAVKGEHSSFRKRVGQCAPARGSQNFTTDLNYAYLDMTVGNILRYAETRDVDIVLEAGDSGGGYYGAPIRLSCGYAARDYVIMPQRD